MKLIDVLQHIAPVRGQSSVINALLTGDISSVTSPTAEIQTSLEEAQAEVARYKQAIETCKSDAAYWGYLGSLEYWQMVVNVLTAAALVGADSLPDVPLPPKDGIVMDLLAKQATFGKEVLRLAKIQSEPPQAEGAR